MMIRTPNEHDAKVFAERKSLLVGFCVLDGLFYVGTQEELQKIACLPVRDDARAHGVNASGSTYMDGE